MAVRFRLLGVPRVEIDGQRWVPPLRKAEGLIYYLLAEGPVPRERLAALFWGERDEEAAQNNLRNALYLARRALPDLVQADRRLVSVRRDEDFDCDLDRIGRIADPGFPGWEPLCEEFLCGFEIPESEEFTSWLRETRQEYREKSLAALKARVTRCYEEERDEELRTALQGLVRLDPFDEDSTLELLELYAKSGETARVVDLFNTYRAKQAWRRRVPFGWPADEGPVADAFKHLPKREIATAVAGIIRSQLPNHKPAHEQIPVLANQWFAKYDEGYDVTKWYTAAEESA